MFQSPALIVMTIAATRMYRSLIEFSDLGCYTSCIFRSVLVLTAVSVRTSFDTFRIRRRRAANTEPKLELTTFAAPIPLNRVEMALHEPSEVYPPANLGQYVSHGPYSTENQSQNKPLVLNIGNDLEKGGRLKRG